MTLYLRVIEKSGKETIILNSLCSKKELKRELFSRVERKNMSKTEAYRILNEGIKVPANCSLLIKVSAQADIIPEKSGNITEYAEVVFKGTVIEVYSNCNYRRATKLDYIMSAMAARMYV